MIPVFSYHINFLSQDIQKIIPNEDIKENKEKKITEYIIRTTVTYTYYKLYCAHEAVKIFYKTKKAHINVHFFACSCSWSVQPMDNPI